MGEMMPQLDILYHQVNPSVPGMSYILLSIWPKGSQRTSKHHRLFLRPLLILQNLTVRLLLKTPLTYVIKHGEMELEPNSKFHPLLTSVHVAGRYSTLLEVKVINNTTLLQTL